MTDSSAAKTKAVVASMRMTFWAKVVVVVTMMLLAMVVVVTMTLLAMVVVVTMTLLAMVVVVVTMTMTLSLIHISEPTRPP